MTVDFNAIVNAHAAAAARVSIPVTPKKPRDLTRDQWTYKGWEISFDMPPIPARNFDWCATSPDFDADCDQYGFFICSGEQVHAATYEELVEAIEEALSTLSPSASPADPAGATGVPASMPSAPRGVPSDG